MMLVSQKSLLIGWLMVATATMTATAASLKVESTVRTIPERGTVTSANLSSGSWSASVIIPSGWKLGTSNGKLILQCQDYGAQIEVSIVAKAAAQDLRTQLLSAPESQVLRSEYSSAVAAGNTVTIEAEQVAADNLRLRTCSVFLTQENSALEFTLTADSQKYEKNQKVLANLVASLRIN